MIFVNYEFTHGKLEARAKAEAAIELAQYRGQRKTGFSHFLSKGLFVGDLGGLTPSCKKILGHYGFLTCVFWRGEGLKNMVFMLSDTRMQLSVMDKQKGRRCKGDDFLVSWRP